jgi:thiol-disulfide isomerase/thioredoxin
MPSKDESDVTTIKIHRPTQVTGSVVDAETGEPIKVFKVITGIWWNDQQAIAWQRRGDDERKGADGKFEFKVTWPYPGHKVLIEADGYLPAESRVFKNDEQKVALEIKLTRGEGYKGIVRDAAGKPTKAKLVIATPTAMAYLMNGTEYREQGGVSCDAGEDGTYSLPAQIGKWAIVAFSDYGYAEVTPEQMAKSKDISLQPWGKVEGVAMIGTKPAAGAELQIYDNRPFDENSPRIYHQQEAKADKDGKFHFDRVRPGDIFVARTVRQGMMSTSTSPVKTSVKPGETVQVTVGGKGRPVVGRIQLPADLAGRDDWQYAMCMMHPKVDYPKPPQVPDEVKGDMEKTKAWYEQWTKSPEGEAYQAAVRKISEANRSYPVVVDPSGTFRADDVEPGTYTVNIQIAERPKERTCGFGESIATGELKFTVAAMSDGRSDEPQDVGTVEVQTLKTVKPGDVAPPIAGKLLDGQDFTLESLKGKYVVLDFWATWCGPCVAEIPNMKSTYEAFAKNEKFAMVSISLDEDAATAKKFTEKQQMAWTQVHLPGVWENAAAKAYGVRGIPSIWLIGPDGKVLEKDLRGEAVKQAIERHLGK